ncbi:MAG: hypothetical protein V2I33_20005 [Kangiellaceae bacterium]|nr:hypothetical protein [Kangiellaceae bacterium]
MHTELHSTQTASDAEFPGITEILKLPAMDALGYVKASLVELIRIKHEYVMQRDYADDSTSDGYEKAL